MQVDGTGRSDVEGANVSSTSISRACDQGRLRARGESALRELSAAIHLLRTRGRHDEADRLTRLHDETAKELEMALRPVRVVS